MPVKQGRSFGIERGRLALCEGKPRGRNAEGVSNPLDGIYSGIAASGFDMQDGGACQLGRFGESNPRESPVRAQGLDSDPYAAPDLKGRRGSRRLSQTIRQPSSMNPQCYGHTLDSAHSRNTAFILDVANSSRRQTCQGC